MSEREAEDGNATLDAKEAEPSSPVDAEAPAAEKDSDGKKDAVVADPNLVDWDGPDDPANPRNWSKKRKMVNTTLVSLSVLYSYVYLITPFLNYYLCIENSLVPGKYIYCTC
jgi:hypothetical protein